MTDFTALSQGQKIERIRSDVAEIHRAITGNGFGLEKGIVGAIGKAVEERKCISDRVENLEDRWDRAKWMVMGGFLGSGGVAGWVVHLLSGSG